MSRLSSRHNFLFQQRARLHFYVSYLEEDAGDFITIILKNGRFFQLKPFVLRSRLSPCTALIIPSINLVIPGNCTAVIYIYSDPVKSQVVKSAGGKNAHSKPELPLPVFALSGNEINDPGRGSCRCGRPRRRQTIRRPLGLWSWRSQGSRRDTSEIVV